MRLAACVLLILLLAACGAAPTPTATATSSAPDLSSTDEVSVISMTIEVPIPGTLVPGLSNMPRGGRPAIEFDTVYFSRSGGIAGQSLSVELRADGTLIRDEETTSVPEATLTEVNERLNRIDFYGLQGIFTGFASSDAYSYNLTVESGIGSRTISAQDGYTPPELLELFDFFSQLGA
jgi:hypothetical protein